MTTLSGTETGGIPVLLKLAGRPAVVVGGGDDATALATALLAHGAIVSVVAVAASIPLHALAASDRIALLSRPYVRGDLAGAIVAACFEDGETAAAVASEALAERCPVYIADHPELSTLSFSERAVQPSPAEEPA